MLRVAVSFANFGPYHLARLRALSLRLLRSGGSLIAYETAGTQDLYPWETSGELEPFDWKTLFPNGALEGISRFSCSDAMRKALDRDRPDVLMTSGYSRPECVAIPRTETAGRLARALQTTTRRPATRLRHLPLVRRL